MAICAMLQRSFDFDRLAQLDPAHVAEATSLPPPEPDRLPPPLVRPDRQFTFDGVSHYEWPAPDHDRDTITVDRIGEDIDGPSHRFVIRRGDAVEVFFGPDRVEIGEVTGISHAKEEVQVSFEEGSEGQWFEKSRIYPTLDLPHEPGRRRETLSSVIDSTNADHAPMNGFTEAGSMSLPTVSALTYTIRDHEAFRERRTLGELSINEVKEEFRRMLQSRDAFISELMSTYNATRLQNFAGHLGSYGARRNTKAENAAAVYKSLLGFFYFGDSLSWSPMQESFDEALSRAVEAQTQEDLDRYFAELREKSEAYDKSLKNPETLEEFLRFAIHRGEAELSDEQLARYDALNADMTRGRRAAEVKTTVEQFQSSELLGYEFQIKEGYHDRRQCPVWVVQLSSRVERTTFDELNRKAKMLGGWYSSFKKSDAGFQFLEEERAKRFAALLSSDADRTDVLEARRERRELSASERLHELASELARRADETIERSDSSLQNTARRADIQAGVRGQAYADQALSRTMHSIAEALSRGEAKYLDGIRHKSHIETLDSVLYLAKWARIRAARIANGESSYSHGRRLDRIEEEPIGPKDVRFAEYPYPCIYKRRLEELVLRSLNTRGVKQSAAKMQKRLSRENDDFVTFRDEHDIEALSEFLSRAKSAGFDVEMTERPLEKYRRLQRANIRDIHELRAALREYLAHRAEARGDDPVRVAERELIGKKLPGFFPTPRPVIERMLELAEIRPLHRVLEPSCGKGDIVDAVKAEHPEAAVHAIEQNLALAEVLSAKGHEVEFADFLLHQGTYDRIVMNPPFENGADIDHVRHAFSLLRPGGRLVSVMSEGPFFRADKKSTDFRDWLEDAAADIERLPEDAFRGTEAFRETAVRTRLVTINKGGI